MIFHVAGYSVSDITMNDYPLREYARNFTYVVADWKHLLLTATESFPVQEQ